MKISRTRILEKFSLIQAARSTREKPICQTIRISAEEGQDRLKLEASSSSAYASVLVELSQKLEKSVEFCADPLFFQILSASPGDEVELQFEGKKRVILKAGHGVHELMVIPAEGFLEPPELEYTTFSLATLIRAFVLGRVAVAEDAHRPALQCFNIDSGVLLASDGKQFVRIELGDFPAHNSLCRPVVAKEFLPLLRYMATTEGETEVAVANTEFTAFRSDNAELVVRTMNAKLFPLDQVFQLALEKNVLVELELPLDDFMASVSLCKLYELRALQGGMPNVAKLSITPNVVSLNTAVSGLSKMDERLNVKAVRFQDGLDEFSIYFSAELLIEILENKVDGVETVTLKFLEGLDAPFLLYFNDFEGFAYMQTATSIKE